MRDFVFWFVNPNGLRINDLLHSFLIASLRVFTPIKTLNLSKQILSQERIYNRQKKEKNI